MSRREAAHFLSKWNVRLPSPCGARSEYDPTTSNWDHVTCRGCLRKRPAKVGA